MVFTWGTRIVRHTRMSCSNGSLFHKKFLNMDTIFYNPLNMCPFYQSQIVKNGPIFWEQSLKMEIFFCQNDPEIWVGLWGSNDTPMSKPDLNISGFHSLWYMHYVHSKTPLEVTVLWLDSDWVVTILSYTSGTRGRLQNHVSVPPWFLHSDCVYYRVPSVFSCSNSAVAY